MDQVFAPWRIEWVERSGKNPDVEECVFCELPEWDDDRENRLLAENDHAYVLLNNYPYNPGHAMVIPRAHSGAYGDLDDAALLDHAHLKQRTIDAMDAAFDPDGYNVGLNLGGSAAGGSIDDHLHTHVVPRWSGDNNFMAVISDTKVIVEALEDSYDRLHDAFADQSGATVTDSDDAVSFS
ncbi:Histidine triad protein [Halorhabdus tiamatea SARL4B]|uniref:Histidine triad protein n=1 Tax=Halorhabdus tiamatea SARL4B TaxID=1033806 RepID=F7PI70_9EURY|nr:HIT domain-containing protein [Halorhabdus tiamatea]ERJ05244.1 Histidine triad protein [Halorhabdus tiamatea SARL4B]CCQ32184.1 bis(5'-adenosyl)-triphosphatase-like histidine triad protein [Halorhabdus tiamatea SARL4B]